METWGEVSWKTACGAAWTWEGSIYDVELNFCPTCGGLVYLEENVLVPLHVLRERKNG